MKAQRSCVLAAALALSAGCSTVASTPPLPTCFDGQPCPEVLMRLTGAPADKVDLLLVVDNSASMAVKEQILSASVSDLIQGLVNPPCVSVATGQGIMGQPAGPSDPCPAGARRSFAPVADMHVGLLSSSLGTFGADGCLEGPPPACPGATATPSDDHGRLVTRADGCGTTTVPTYQSEGFLAWDPAQKLTPPGNGNLGGLVGSLVSLVTGDGYYGCGFSSQNEAWYRFLVDPTPYASIALVNGVVHTAGIDDALLQQRADFLRPDSLLVIVNVTDKPESSLKETSSYPLFAAPELHLPHPRQECATKGPEDPCCASCGQTTPAGCPTDPTCTSSPDYTDADENQAIRRLGLISHKQRYGIEFFYPPSRYVDALTMSVVMDANGKEIVNPIYTNLNPAKYMGAVRDPTMVFYAAVVGVPWQLIARQKNGVPDLINGVSALDPTQVGGFKTAAELDRADPIGNVFWDDIAGDPERYVPAKSPFMVEATSPRSGTDPITGIAIDPVTTPNGTGNAINDHEWTISTPPSDIEYACLIDLPQPIDCSIASTSPCDCASTPQTPPDSPLCSPNPADGGRPTLQTKAKVYPGVKHLAIARGLDSQGIVASLCPAQLADPTKPDYGYRPAMRAIVDRLSQTLGNTCLPRQLTADAQGEVKCVVLEGRRTGGACSCDPAARVPVPAGMLPLVTLAQESLSSGGLDCFCEIPQASGAALDDCRTSPTPTSNGWCYVDALEGPAEAAIVAGCPQTERRELRFVGTGQPMVGATAFLGCIGQ